MTAAAVDAVVIGLRVQRPGGRHRPVPGLGRPETPLPGLFLVSAFAHPGGGVHGVWGWNAAPSALRAAGRTGRAGSALTRTAWDRLLRPVG